MSSATYVNLDAVNPITSNSQRWLPRENLNLNDEETGIRNPAYLEVDEEYPVRHNYEHHNRISHFYERKSFTIMYLTACLTAVSISIITKDPDDVMSRLSSLLILSICLYFAVFFMSMVLSPPPYFNPSIWNAVVYSIGGAITFVMSVVELVRLIVAEWTTLDVMFAIGTIVWMLYIMSIFKLLNKYREFESKRP